MSVVIDTSYGALVVDLETEACPNTSKNFLKLCKTKYYNGCLFYNVQQDFCIQSGDTTATGRGGTSIYGKLYGSQARYFEDEIHSDLRHNVKGTLSMANTGQPNSNGSQFLITTRSDCSSFNDRNTVFGRVVEGMDVLDRINGAICDESGRPYQDIRIARTHVLVDPFPDPPGLAALIPPASPAHARPQEEAVSARIPAEEELELELAGERNVVEERAHAETMAAEEARSRAIVLELTGDLPSADVTPPENVLFVCKLNPATDSGSLETIFSRFGELRSAEVIRDKGTGNSLCYAFVEFADVPGQPGSGRAACETAYTKMNNVLIDDRRIKVDFSQSVSRLWNTWSRDKKQGGGGKHNTAQQGSRQAAAPSSSRTAASAPAAPPAPFDERRGGLQRATSASGRPQMPPPPPAPHRPVQAYHPSQHVRQDDYRSAEQGRADSQRSSRRDEGHGSGSSTRWDGGRAGSEGERRTGDRGGERGRHEYEGDRDRVGRPEPHSVYSREGEGSRDRFDHHRDRHDRDRYGTGEASSSGGHRHGHDRPRGHSRSRSRDRGKHSRHVPRSRSRSRSGDRHRHTGHGHSGRDRERDREHR